MTTEPLRRRQRSEARRLRDDRDEELAEARRLGLAAQMADNERRLEENGER